MTRLPGFKHLGVLVHLDVHNLLAIRRWPGETQGQTLERLLLGEAKDRPVSPELPPIRNLPASERAAERARRYDAWLHRQLGIDPNPSDPLPGDKP